METIFKSALVDPSLFHALSLVLSLGTANNLPNVEVLSHRAVLLSGIRINIKSLDGVPRVSTMSAMLLLIGYEYRIDGANCRSIAAHIKGLQAMMKICKERNVALVDEVQRALFWQDLLSSLMTGTPRFLSHNDFHDLRIPEGLSHAQDRQVPVGFHAYIHEWPPAFVTILQDLADLCRRVDSECTDDGDALFTFPIEKSQANLESRLVDLLNECRSSPIKTDPIYEAAIYCTYVCTYKLAIGIWMGCYIPEICIGHILQLIPQSLPQSPNEPTSELLRWLLFTSGAFTEREEFKTRIANIIRETEFVSNGDIDRSWEALKETLGGFVWCKRTMERKVFTSWQEVCSAHRSWQ